MLVSENLQATKYLNGDSINHITNQTTWENMTTGAWCDYNNVSSNGTIYGHLYNWYSANDNRSLCLVGWYVPTYDEWTILFNYLGGTTIAGGAMKETGQHCGIVLILEQLIPVVSLPYPAATVTTTCGAFEFQGIYAYFWISSEFTVLCPWFSYMNYDITNAGNVLLQLHKVRWDVCSLHERLLTI